MVEESIARKKKTSDANLFLVPFDRYNLSESMPLGSHHVRWIFEL